MPIDRDTNDQNERAGRLAILLTRPRRLAALLTRPRRLAALLTHWRFVAGTPQDLVVASNGVGGATFSAGASGNSLSGAFYFPSGPITLSGAGSVGNGAGQCLELIGLSITRSGGWALASTCSDLPGSASGGTVVLVQ